MIEYQWNRNGPYTYIVTVDSDRNKVTYYVAYLAANRVAGDPTPIVRRIVEAESLESLHAIMLGVPTHVFHWWHINGQQGDSRTPIDIRTRLHLLEIVDYNAADGVLHSD